MPARVALRELVERFGGTCDAPTDLQVTGFASIDDAGPDQLAFLTSARYRDAVAATRAGAVLVTQNDADALSGTGARLWICRDPYLHFARIAQWFEAANRPARPSGIHPSAVVDPTASIDASATIGPNVVIGARAIVAADVSIGAGSIVGEDSSLGAGSLLHANVTLYGGCRLGERCIVHAGAVIGSDGFGFARDKTGWVKIPQTGGVEIGSDVEIGANTTIDRGALNHTRIGDGVKLDNQIQVAHNVVIGEHTVMAALVGIAGSAVIGKRCMIGGAARIMGHVTIADDVVVSTQTFVSRSITKPGQYTGYFPMSDHASFERNAAVLRRLDGLRDRLKALEAGRPKNNDNDP